METITRPDGRSLAIHRLVRGTTGRTVLLCHAAPGSGVFDPDPEQTWARGVTLLGVDRPGYGRSDPTPDGIRPTLAEAADDLAATIEREGGAPVGVAGWAVGGYVALALAARHPQLVGRLALIATPAPHEAIPWQTAERAALYASLRASSPEAARIALTQHLALRVPASGAACDLNDLLGASPADRAAMAQAGVQERLNTMLVEAFAQGAVGLADDIARAALQPWGFAPQDIPIKTLLIYGAKDPLAGAKHGRWWQKQLPDARLEMVPNAGSLVIATMWKRILSHLAPGGKRS